MEKKNMDSKVMFQLTYGLFVLTAKEGTKDNGCIINTVSQVTDHPNRISVTINKQCYTHDMIMKTNKFNVSILSEEAGFDLFQRFGFQSGKDTDKFEGLKGCQRAKNGILYLTRAVNAYISGSVVDKIDLGSHTLLIADVTEGEILSSAPSVTYTYYHKYIKPKPKETKKKGWICVICGYIYEGEELPPDYICPICKHGAEDFVKIE